MLTNLLFVVLGYLAGSISTAILVCRAMGLPDPRSEGSRNPGATNVLRFGGKKAAAITLAGDFAKGLLPVLLARLAGVEDTGLALTALAAASAGDDSWQLRNTADAIREALRARARAGTGV